MHFDLFYWHMIHGKRWTSVYCTTEVINADAYSMKCCLKYITKPHQININKYYMIKSEKNHNVNK